MRRSLLMAGWATTARTCSRRNQHPATKAKMGSEKAMERIAGSTPLNTSSTNSEKIAA